MTSSTSDFESNFSQNPILLNLFTHQQEGTASAFNIDEHINTAWPVELFPKIEIVNKNYGPLPYVERASSVSEQQKENEWLELVGMDFYSLSDEKRNFLLKTAGIFNFGEEIDIKKVYTTSIY